MTNYISIRSALRFIPKALFDYSSDLDFLSWMLDGFRYIDLPITFESKIKFLEIQNNKVTLPSDIREINAITYLYKDPSASDTDNLSSCCVPESNSTESDTNNICRYTIAYKQFLDSKYYKNNFMPLQYKGNYSDSILCDKCPNRFSPCQNYFTIDKNKILHTNLDCGFLCIDYSTEMKDENGEFLIPDYTEIKQYLAYYAMAKHWEERAAIKEQSAAQMSQDFLVKAETYLKKARGMFIMRGLDANSISAAIYDGYQNYIKIPELYVYSR